MQEEVKSNLSKKVGLTCQQIHIGKLALKLGNKLVENPNFNLELFTDGMQHCSFIDPNSIQSLIIALQSNVFI